MQRKMTVLPLTKAQAKFPLPKQAPIRFNAVVNGTESNRVALQVLPERYLDTLTITSMIPDLIYNDDTANTFDLSNLDVDARDQYGERHVSL